MQKDLLPGLEVAPLVPAHSSSKRASDFTGNGVQARKSRSGASSHGTRSTNSSEFGARNEARPWDITKLMGPAKSYFYRYVIIDIERARHRLVAHQRKTL
jgi:hypothetical protein